MAVTDFVNVEKDTTVRVFDVSTPSDEFNGLRAKVEFRHGRASLYEPRKVDFDDDERYEAERDSFRNIIETFKRYGYTIRYRDVVSTPPREAENDDEDWWTED